MMKQIKAIAGATVAGLAGAGGSMIIVPPEVAMPWWGHVIVGALNALAVYGTVYLAPKNAG
jgi:uncharacterized membrane protein YfcA